MAQGADPTAGDGHLPLVAGDVSEVSTARRAVACAHERFGGLDVHVNNAGMDHPAGLAYPPVKGIRQLFDVNSFGAQHMTPAAVPALATHRNRAIVNATSRLSCIRVRTMTLYGASKGLGSEGGLG